MTKTNPKKNSLPTPKRKAKPTDLFALVEGNESPETEAKRFSRYVKGPTKKEMVSDSLSEIYEDDKGGRINVQEVNIKRRRNLWLRIGLPLLYCAATIAIIVAGWKWFTERQEKASPITITIAAETGVIANQEFTYTIDYQNHENTTLTKVELVAVYPENFILTDSSPTVSQNSNNKWQLPDIKPFGSGRVQVRGRLLAPTGQSNILFVDLSYQPEGITSSFKKSASLDVIISASGLDLVTTPPGSLLVGEEKPLEVSWLLQEKNYLDTFSLRVKTSEHLAVRASDKTTEGIRDEGNGVWKINPKDTTESLSLLVKALDKGATDQKETVALQFEYTPEGSDRAYLLEEKIISIEIVKNSLNLSLTANGQSVDQGVDFGQVINYSISYANKGEATMNNVIISAVLDGDALDWSELEDRYNGKIVGSSIIWTPAEIPALAALATNQQGTINFSIPVRPSNEARLVSRYEIKSYAQFSLTDKTEVSPEEATESNRSNEIMLKLNSDIALDEAVRYFNEDNIAVGTGPLPSEVGQRTTLKVYWKITNSLHELGNLKVTTKLPSGVTWDGKDIVSVGSLSYNESTNEVTWYIGRLPVSVPEIQAEFSIALEPRASDRNRLMILVSGTNVTAQDNQTSFTITKQFKAQTTKLEKDEIANTDGIIR